MNKKIHDKYSLRQTIGRAIQVAVICVFILTEIQVIIHLFNLIFNETFGSLIPKYQESDLVRCAVIAVVSWLFILYLGCWTLRYFLKFTNYLYETFFTLGLQAWFINLYLADGKCIEFIYDSQDPQEIERKNQFLHDITHVDILVINNPQNGEIHIPRHAIVRWTVFESGVWFQNFKKRNGTASFLGLTGKSTNNIIQFPSRKNL